MVNQCDNRRFHINASDSHSNSGLDKLGEKRRIGILLFSVVAALSVSSALMLASAAQSRS
jgi:hypothetical protein